MGKVNPSITYDEQELDVLHTMHVLWKKLFQKRSYKNHQDASPLWSAFPEKSSKNSPAIKKNYDMNIVEKGRRLKLVALWL